MADDFQTLVRSGYALVVVETHEEERVLAELRRAATELKLPLLTWSLTRGLCRDGEDTSIYKTEKAPMMLAHIAAAGIPAIYFLQDFQSQLADAFSARQLREIAQLPRAGRPTLVLCAPSFQVPETLEKEVIRHDFRPPSRDELRKLVRDRIQDRGDVALKISRTDFEQLLSHLEGMTFREAERVVGVLLTDGSLSAEDLSEVVRQKHRLVEQSGVLEWIDVPGSLDDVGGLAQLKDWLLKRARAFSPEARALGLDPPKGVLLLGVQGCGKSLCAKAVAAAWRMPLLRFDPASLYDKYVGESEKNLQRALAQAGRMAPSVLWIDEIEKALGTAGGGDADGGLSRRILGSFLGWMQERARPVFVVATANDITLLPPELLRKGRFDEIFFVDLPSFEARQRIFRIHLLKRKQDPEVIDLGALALATEGFSGAEIEQAVIDALYEVLAGRAFDTGLLLSCIGATRPLSVVMSEKVRALHQWALGRTVPADGATPA